MLDNICQLSVCFRLRKLDQRGIYSLIVKKTWCSAIDQCLGHDGAQGFPCRHEAGDERANRPDRELAGQIFNFAGHCYWLCGRCCNVSRLECLADQVLCFCVASRVRRTLHCYLQLKGSGTMRSKDGEQVVVYEEMLYFTRSAKDVGLSLSHLVLCLLQCLSVR